MKQIITHDFFAQSGLILCTAGWQNVLVNGRPYKLSSGTLMLTSPLYVIQSVEKSADYKGVSILTTPHNLYNTLQQVSKIVTRLHMLNRPCLHLEEQMVSRLCKNAEEIEHWQLLISQTQDANENRMMSLIVEQIAQKSIYEVVLYIYQHTPEISQQDTKHETVFFDFITRLQQELNVQRSVSYYAQRANLSVGHFSTIIRQILGTPPSSLIIAFTISNAKMLLSKTDKSIKVIASELGFPEQYTFRKYFKQYTGMSPTDYRTNYLSQ